MRKGSFSIGFLISLFATVSLANAQTCNLGQTCCNYTPVQVKQYCNSLPDYTYCTSKGQVTSCSTKGAQQQTGAYCCTCSGNPDQCAYGYYSIFSADGTLVVDPGGCAAYNSNTQQPTCEDPSKAHRK